jgi:hypothetical protein
MKHPSWLSRVFSRRRTAGGTCRGNRSTRPRLESLEDRTLLSAAANQAFVSQVYLDVLNRPVDSGALAFWSGALGNNVPRGAVIAAITNSAEFRTVEVQDLYNDFLQRPADPVALKSFSDYLTSGGTAAQVAAILAGSPEYFHKSGGAVNAGFMAALFSDALGRDITPDALSAGTQALASGMPPKQMAAAVFGSAEYKQAEVSQLYRHLLRRPADAAGLQFFANALAGGFRLQDVIAALAASPEYLSLASGLQIKSLSASSGQPGSLLTITGSGFDPNAQLSVRFTDSSNNSLAVPVLDAQPWQLTVAVPPFINLATGTSGSAAVQLQLVQQSNGQTVTSTGTTSFQIVDLPQTGAAAGAWATALVNHAQTALQAAVGNLQKGAATYHADVSSLLTQVQTQEQKLTTLSQELAGVLSGQTAKVSLGAEGNVALTLDSSSLGLIDRYLAAAFGSSGAAAPLGPRQMLPAMLRSQTIDPEQTVAARFADMLAGGFDATKEFMLNFREHTEAGLGLLGAALLLAPEAPVVATAGALAALGSVGVWTATTFLHSGPGGRLAKQQSRHQQRRRRAEHRSRTIRRQERP